MEVDENDRSLGNREPQGKDRSPTHYRKALGLPEILMRQFRHLAQSLTSRAHDAELPQRRRADETRGGFRLAAKQLMYRSVDIPSAAFAAITFLSETLDWLNPWHHTTASNDGFDDDFHATEQEHIYPQL